MPVWLDFGVENDIPLFYWNPVEDRTADNERHQMLQAAMHNYLYPNLVDQSPDDEDFDPEWRRVTMGHFFFFFNGEVVDHWFANADDILQEETRDLDAARARFEEMFATLQQLIDDCPE
jgi:hypothetical protein